MRRRSRPLRGRERLQGKQRAISRESPGLEIRLVESDQLAHHEGQGSLHLGSPICIEMGSRPRVAMSAGTPKALHEQGVGLLRKMADLPPGCRSDLADEGLEGSAGVRHGYKSGQLLRRPEVIRIERAPAQGQTAGGITAPEGYFLGRRWGSHLRAQVEEPSALSGCGYRTVLCLRLKDLCPLHPPRSRTLPRPPRPRGS